MPEPRKRASKKPAKTPAKKPARKQASKSAPMRLGGLPSGASANVAPFLAARRGYGRNAYVDDTFTHYTVTSTSLSAATSGSLAWCLAQTGPSYITFDPALGDIGSDGTNGANSGGTRQQYKPNSDTCIDGTGYTGTIFGSIIAQNVQNVIVMFVTVTQPFTYGTNPSGAILGAPNSTDVYFYHCTAWDSGDVILSAGAYAYGDHTGDRTPPYSCTVDSCRLGPNPGPYAMMSPVLGSNPDGYTPGEYNGIDNDARNGKCMESAYDHNYVADNPGSLADFDLVYYMTMVNNVMQGCISRNGKARSQYGHVVNNLIVKYGEPEPVSGGPNAGQGSVIMDDAVMRHYGNVYIPCVINEQPLGFMDTVADAMGVARIQVTNPQAKAHAQDGANTGNGSFGGSYVPPGQVVDTAKKTTGLDYTTTGPGGVGYTLTEVDVTTHTAAAALVKQLEDDTATRAGNPYSTRQPPSWRVVDLSGLFPPETPPSNTILVTNPGDQTVTVGKAVTLSIAATDTSGTATLSYAATGLPAGLAIDPTTGVISGFPTTEGSSSSTVTVTDDTGATGSVSFGWTVNPTPQITPPPPPPPPPPVLTPPAGGTASVSEPTYSPTNWVNASLPALNDDDLNHLELGVKAATERAAASMRYDAAQSLSSAQIATAQANLGVTRVTPQQFGTVGTSDDSAVFQAAISYCLANNAELVIPSGTYVVTNLAAVSNTACIRIRGLQAPGFDNPAVTMPVTLKNKTGATTPIITFTRGTELVNLGFDGNGTTPTTGLVYAAATLELRMSGIKIYNCASTGLLLSGCDNVFITGSVMVKNCGSSSKAAVRIESYWSGSAQTVCNSVNIDNLLIYGAPNCALDIGSGSTPTQTDYAEFLLINRLHCEGPDLFGQPGNAGPLVKIGNVRHVMVNTFLLYGGAGPLIDYSATITSYATNILGGVHFSSGVLLGAAASFGTEPVSLVTLGGGNGGTGLGDGFTLGHASMDNCSGAAVSIASTFGPTVTLGAVYPTSHVASLLSDGRSKLTRKPTDSSLPGVVARGRRIHTGSGLWVCTPGAVSTSTPALNVLNAHRFILDSQVTVTSLAAEVTVGAAGASIRIGIYADNDGMPGELLHQSASLTATSAGILTDTLSASLYPGAYWLGVVAQGAAVNMRCITPYDLIGMATSTLALQNTLTGWGVGAVTGALPSPWAGGNGTSGLMPRVALQIA